jgi:uncharacterized protein RhaS with RHS repeats
MLLCSLLFVLLEFALPARAFYDPSLGRWINRDPVAEAGGINLYGFVANNPVSRGDYWGLAAEAVGAPRFNPNDPRWNGNENCYSYACNRSSPKRDQMDRQPGNQRCGNDCDKIISGAKKDGAIDVPADGRCPPGFHKIHAVAGSDIGGNPDYHFYRQDDDGRWSHKRGWDGQPERADGSGNPITNPVNANHDYRKAKPRGGNYGKNCGSLCVPN